VARLHDQPQKTGGGGVKGFRGATDVRFVARRGAATLLAALVVLGSCDAGKVRFALRLAQGARYGVTVTTDQTIRQTVQGQEVVIRQTLATDYGVAVQSVGTDGKTTLVFTYERVAADIDGPMGKATYDSAAPPAEVPPLLAAYAAIVGLGYSVTVTPDLRVDGVAGVDALLDALVARFPGLDDAGRAAAVSILREEFGEDAARQVIENGFAVVPTGPVGIGDTWTRAARVRIGVPLIVDATYTLTAREAGAATIGVTGTYRTDPDKPGLTMGAITLDLDLAGTHAGTVVLDEATGWVARSDVSQDVQGRMTLDNIGGIPAGIDWPLSVQGKTTVRVVPRP
jgi:hypothetical protein